MDNDTNASFGLPAEARGAVPPAAAPVTVAAPATPETQAQRIAALRIKAEEQAASEFDEGAVYAKLLEEARAKRADQIKNAVEFPVDTQGFPAEYVKVTIFKGQNKNDLSYVPLGIGGFVIKVPRGEEVILPKVFVTECLEHAIEEITVQSQGGLVTRPAHRFPFNTGGPATAEEYKAYQASQRSKAQMEAARLPQ